MAHFWPTGRASGQLPAHQEGLLITSGPPKGPPAHFLPTERAYGPLPAQREGLRPTFDPPCGHPATRVDSVPLPDHQSGLWTTSSPLGGTADHFQITRRALRPFTAL